MQSKSAQKTSDNYPPTNGQQFVPQMNSNGSKNTGYMRGETYQRNNNVDSQNIGLNKPHPPKYQQPQLLTKMKDINKNVLNNDYSYLHGRKQVIDVIRTIRKHKQIMTQEIINQCKYFLDLVKAKIQYYSYSQIVYWQLLLQTDKLSQCLQYQGNRKNIKSPQQQTDKIFQHYIQQLETKPRRQSKYYFGPTQQHRKEIGEYMGETSKLFDNSKWRTIMEITKYEIQRINLQEVRSDNPQIVKILRRMDYSSTIHKQKTMNLGCLGCTSHFINNWNIFDQSVQKTKLVLVGKALDLIPSKSSSEKLEKIQRTLKRQICGLINCGGGVILFDCEKRYLDVLAKGQLISKNEAKTILESIEKLLQSLVPSPKIKKNVIVSFVPVSKDPITQSKVDLLKSDQQNITEYFGSYVTRIVVRPTVNTTHAYRHDSQLFQCFRFKSLYDSDDCFKQQPAPVADKDQGEDNKHKKQADKLTGSQSQIAASAGSPCKDDDWLTSLISGPYTDFDHQECQRPAHGSDIPSEMSDQQLSTNASQQFDPEQKFQFATAMVVKKQNYEQFKKKLQRQDFQYHVEFPFPNSKIKGANATVILYHNVSHAQVKNRITLNSNFQFNGRNTITVAVTNHIKLINRLNRNTLPQQQFSNLQLWMDQQFKDDRKITLEMVSQKNQYNEIEYFIKPVGDRSLRKGTLFIYLLTNHFNERSQLRNPNKL